MNETLLFSEAPRFVVEEGVGKCARLVRSTVNRKLLGLGQIRKKARRECFWTMIRLVMRVLVTPPPLHPLRLTRLG